MLDQNKSVAYCLLRMAFGVNFLGHGFFRVLGGVGNFASSTAQHMNKSPFPYRLNYSFALASPGLSF